MILMFSMINILSFSKKKKIINILIILTYENTILNKSYNKPKYFINDYVLEYNYIDINILISFSILIFYLSYTCLEQKYDIWKKLNV